MILKSDLDDLYQITVPTDTKTYKAVPHADFVEHLDRCLEASNFNVVGYQHQLAKKGKQLFGTFDLLCNTAGYRYSVGFRNSYDKSLALGVVAGVRIIVCSNLCFSGDIKYVRKHTSGLDLEKSILDVIEEIKEPLDTVQLNLDKLKLESITERDRAGILVEIAKESVINYKDIPKVINGIDSDVEFFQHRLDMFGLLMGVTDFIKRQSPCKFHNSQQKLSNIFKLN